MDVEVLRYLAFADGPAGGNPAGLVLNAAGEVPITTRRTGLGAVEVSFTSVEPRTRPIPADRWTRLLDLLGLTDADIAAGYPPLEAFAGSWHPVLVLADRELFRQFSFAPGPLAELMGDAWAGTVTVLHRRSESEYEARNLFPVGRITEDPATGSAAASTGAYLREVGKVPADRHVSIAQGARVGRPSRLEVHIPASGGITVTGTATEIGTSQPRSISATRKASSSDCWVFSRGSQAVS